MAHVTAGLMHRFWSKVDLTGECWTWTAAVNRQGYGQFWDPERKTMGLAHRFAFEHFVGPLCHHRFQPGPIGDVVCHRCDNPACVRPEHLFLGTQLDNMRDASGKGRVSDRTGARNGRAKLTAAEVEQIRLSVTGRHGERSEIARRWGISTGHVSKILKADVWM